MITQDLVLNMTKLCGSSCDALQTCVAGTLVLLQKTTPKHLHVWCAAHRFSLLVKDAMDRTLGECSVNVMGSSEHSGSSFQESAYGSCTYIDSDLRTFMYSCNGKK